MPDLAILVPTRGRPENIRKVISAWDFTNAWDHADLILVADADDPEIQGYRDVVALTKHPDTEEELVKLAIMDEWQPMVHKLNLVADVYAQTRGYFALGFAGDDHLPQTINWAKRYLTVLRELGTGMVYGDDGYQGRKLSTEWAVTSDVVRALGRMVPAPVEHMYCDNSMMDLFGAAGALKHLPEIRIEHMHPVAGKAERDEQYDRVNHRDQFSKDRRSYERWRNLGRAADVALVRDLRKGRPDVSTDPAPRVPRAIRVIGSGPRRVERSGPSANRPARTPQPDRTPRHFRNVRAATPEDIMITLADFATQVPADQEIVELGVFCGRTALQMAWGASLGNGAHVTAIDPWDLPGNVYSPPFTDAESRTWAHHWVQSLGYSEKITLVHGFSHEVPWSGPPVGLLYVDGDHTKEGAKRDMVVWSERLAPGAIIAVDDYGHPDWPGVGEAVDELVAEGVLETIEIFHDRLAVTRLTERQEWAILGHAGEPTPTTAELIEEANQYQPDGVVHPPVTAITSEGVSLEPDTAALEAEWERVDPEGVAALRESGAALVSEMSKRAVVSIGEAIQVEGTRAGQSIEELNTVQLRALAKVREIVLGARKDKRADMLQALRDGR
jgi:predicted O-methyltransferase YrrM